MVKKFLILCFIGMSCCAKAQELNARVTIVSNQIRSSVDKKVFNTLQTALNNFLNTRKWSNEVYQQQEKIVCNFLINLQEVSDDNVYKATLTVQGARPVFNTSYQSPLINFQDGDFVFRYVEFQAIEFNDNRVQGTDPVASNLTAVLAYYVYMILALDGDSFSPRGGDPYFQKVQNVVNNAPDGRGITGWKAFDGIRNRYWLMENFTNNRYTMIHDAYYTYYRQALDKFYEDENGAREQVFNCLNNLNTLNTQNPNLMVMQFFFQGRWDEFIKIFKRAAPQDKARATELLSRLDVSNAGRYREELK